jgi:ABC-type multidrug transport system permease subunit
LLQSVIFGLFVGLLFFQLGDEQVDVQNKTGALFFIILNQIMSNVFSTVESFPSYLKMFKYDYKRGKYPLLVYYLCKTSVDIPFQLTSTFVFCLIALLMTNLTHHILECAWIMFFVALSGSSFGYMMSTVSDQFSVCIIATNVCILPMMLTSGLFINNTSIPIYIAWLQELNPFYFGYNALSTLIWKDETIRCDENDLCPYSSGEDVLDYQGISRSNNTVTLFGLIILFRMMGYIIMCIRLRQI